MNIYKSLYQLSTVVSLVILLGIASCNKSAPGFTINGSGDLLTEGQAVYLTAYPSGNEITYMDSAIVKNGQFHFEGNPDSIIRPHYLSFLIDGKPQAVLLFLEHGVLQVKVDRAMTTVRGTALNDAFQSFMQDIKPHTARVNNLYQRIEKDTTLTADSLTSLREQMYKEDSVGLDIVLKTTEANISNGLGVFLLSSYGAGFSGNQLGKLLTQIPTAYASDAAIQRLQDKMQQSNQFKIGNVFLELKGNTPQGTALKLSDMIPNNKYTLVEFWAGWCPDCRRELPELINLYQEYKYKGLEILGFSLDTKMNNWTKAIADLHLPWPQISDLKGEKSPVLETYAIRDIPYNVLIDQQGIIVGINLHGTKLTSRLAELIK